MSGTSTKRTLGALMVLFCVSVIPALAMPRQCALPQPVGAVLDPSWRGWRLLQLADLRSDDQALWREHPTNGKHCPGVNQGKFDGLHTGFVFTLVRNSEEQVVMVAIPNGDSYKTTVLVRPMNVPYFSVVNVFPPGKYKGFYTERVVRIGAVSAAVEAIEASITLFYFENGRWQSLLISD